MPDNSALQRFLQAQEGQKEDVYTDTQGNPTIGVGANLNSPEVPKIMEQMNIPHEDVKSGQRVLTSEEQQELLNKQIEDKKNYFENIRKRDFSNAQIAPHEQTALQSLMHNSPQLVGPTMRDLLDRNLKSDVSKEILLRSNKYKEPGLEKRRLNEASQYSGPDFENVIKTLTDDEKTQIRDVIKGIKNINERNKVMEQYPFLKEIIPPRSYGKILKD